MVILVFVLLIYISLQNNWIEVEHQEVKINNLPESLQGLIIAHISDVHIPKNAANINKLLSKVGKEKPDIILMTGDIIDKGALIEDPDLDKLCMGLTSIAKTYAVTGNHEASNNNLVRFREILKKNHVEIVENKVEIYEKNNARLAIMGLKDGENYSYEPFENIEAVKDMPKILLAHRPELFNTYQSDSYTIKPDLVFSGHAHGGQFRIPFLKKGIIAPNQGLFPKYTSGLYSFDNGIQVMVSRGLGNSIIPIRINNRPHLPIIRLK